MSQVDCKRAILTGHNASFDLSFINEALKRNKIQKNFLYIALVHLIQQLSLWRILWADCISKGNVFSQTKWDPSQAHSAVYDAEGTADLFVRS